VAKPCGTPQGGVADLSVIYMNRFLKHWRLTRRGEAFHAHVVSYADDFVILSRGNADEALTWTKAVMTKLGLTLNEAKTSVKNARREGFDFLGYTLGPRHLPNGGRWYLGASPSKKSVRRIKTKVGELRRQAKGRPKCARSDLLAVVRIFSMVPRRAKPLIGVFRCAEASSEAAQSTGRQTSSPVSISVNGVRVRRARTVAVGLTETSQAGCEARTSERRAERKRNLPNNRALPRLYRSSKKRHLLVDTLGLLLHAIVHPADIQDRNGGILLLATLFGMYPFLKKLFADGGYQGPEFQKALTRILPQLKTEIVKRSDHAKGFVVLPRRWVVERTIAWLNRCRRLAKDWENLNRKALAFLRLASIPG
jgi:transposase